ncbi:hypothetical protein Btru_028523 [Bulinus truncatus]|nr:hypothetical protein Btru_028523 [Bulinus truncatus]
MQYRKLDSFSQQDMQSMQYRKLVSHDNKIRITISEPVEPTNVKTNVVERVLSSPGSPFGVSLVENVTSRFKRAVGIATKPWPHKIPYVIDDTYKILGPRITMILKRAMKYIMDRVCIEFVDVTDTYKRNESNWLVNNGFKTNSYINITNTGGCSSNLGYGTTGGGRITKPCNDIWINLHELGHSIGARHVQESPTRDNYISVYADNIQPSLRFSYNRYSDSVISSYVDPQSVLMYGSKTWSVNGLETYVPIMDDFFSSISETSIDDALYFDLNQLYKCRETYCNDSSVDCSPGYMARVKGACRCVCPEERDEGNNCKTLRNGPLAYAQWPNTPMVLLAGGPQHKCPEGFTKGWFSFTGRYPMTQDPKPPVVFPFSGNTNYIPVCTKDTPTGSDIDWESWNPGGQYCMIKPNVTCGGAFVESQADIKSLAAITINGSVGDTTINGNNLTQKYCCRFQESSTFPTELPNAAPFRLFVRGTCPKIRGLKFTNTRNNWWSSVTSVKNISNSPWWYFPKCLATFTCYYQPPVYGSRIKIKFNTVDLSTTNDDTFQYKRFHKWQSPYKINPTNWPKDVVSEDDYFTAEYWSGFDVTTKKGVSFTATLITPNDMCYDVKLKGADYSGNTNISETFEECLPWSKALDCADFPKSSSIWLLQSGNFCRNPRGELLHPYCYVNINGTTCQKRYCDVCSLKTSVDLIKTCSSLIAADPTFCSTSFSKYGCAKSCAYAPVTFKREFKDSYISAYPELKKELAYQKLQILWNECKRNKDDIKHNIVKFKAIAARRRSKLISLWSNVAATKSSSDSATASGNSKAGDCDIASIVPKANSKVENGKTDNEEKIDELSSKNNQHKTDQCNALKFEKNRPAERIAQEELNLTNSKLSEDPIAAKKLKKFTRKKLGRPCIESDQSDLLKSIVDIVSASGAADDRRRSELIRSCTCHVPTVPSDGTLVNSPKSTYNEGEIVQVKCKTSSSYPVSEMRCTQTGWTSLSSACKGGCGDKVIFCQDLLRTFPRFCSHTKTKDSAVQYCAKSCANCTVTKTCRAPSVSTISRTSVSDTVNNGDVMTFSCNAGLYYWSGNYERACGLNGELLGRNLDCQSKPPVTDVNLNLVRKRTELLKRNIAYLLDKDEFKIPVKGVVTRWHYYCKTPGVMTFAVYRKTSNVFSYVGANNVTCQPDYLMTYYVPAESQIPVEVNDILAVHSTASNTLYVTDCNGYNLVPLNTQTIAANTFSELTNKTVSGTYCLIPSFGARVTPDDVQTSDQVNYSRVSTGVLLWGACRPNRSSANANT